MMAGSVVTLLPGAAALPVAATLLHRRADGGERQGMKRIMALAALAGIAATKPPPAPPPEGVQTAQPAAEGGYPYLIFVPHGLWRRRRRSAGRWSSSSTARASAATDIELVKKNGPPKIIDAAPRITVHRWSRRSSKSVRRAAAGTPPSSTRCSPHLRKAYRVDPARIYLTGLSLGGYAHVGLGVQAPRSVRRDRARRRQ